MYIIKTDENYFKISCLLWNICIYLKHSVNKWLFSTWKILQPDGNSSKNLIHSTSGFSGKQKYYVFSFPSKCSWINLFAPKYVYTFSRKVCYFTQIIYLGTPSARILLHLIREQAQPAVYSFQSIKTSILTV